MGKVTLVITVKNEAKSIDDLLWSIESQTRTPDEVVIVDGGSTDATYDLLQQWYPPFAIQIMQKVGN